MKRCSTRTVKHGLAIIACIALAVPGTSVAVEVTLTSPESFFDFGSAAFGPSAKVGASGSASIEFNLELVNFDPLSTDPFSIEASLEVGSFNLVADGDIVQEPLSVDFPETTISGLSVNFSGPTLGPQVHELLVGPTPELFMFSAFAAAVTGRVEIGETAGIGGPFNLNYESVGPWTGTLSGTAFPIDDFTARLVLDLTLVTPVAPSDFEPPFPFAPAQTGVIAHLEGTFPFQLPVLVPLPASGPLLLFAVTALVARRKR